MSIIKITNAANRDSAENKTCFPYLVERSKKDDVSSLNCDAKIFVTPINTKNRYKKTLVWSIFANIFFVFLTFII